MLAVDVLEQLGDTAARVLTVWRGALVGLGHVGSMAATGKYSVARECVCCLFSPDSFLAEITTISYSDMHFTALLQHPDSPDFCTLIAYNQ